MRKRITKVLLGLTLALLILLAPIALIREETWQYTNAAGQPLMTTWGYRLVGMGPPSPGEMTSAVRVTGHGEGWFGLFRFSVDRPYRAQ